MSYLLALGGPFTWTCDPQGGPHWQTWVVGDIIAPLAGDIVSQQLLRTYRPPDLFLGMSHRRVIPHREEEGPPASPAQSGFPAGGSESLQTSPTPSVFVLPVPDHAWYQAAASPLSGHASRRQHDVWQQAHTCLPPAWGQVQADRACGRASPPFSQAAHCSSRLHVSAMVVGVLHVIQLTETPGCPRAAPVRPLSWWPGGWPWPALPMVISHDPPPPASKGTRDWTQHDCPGQYGLHPRTWVVGVPCIGVLCTDKTSAALTGDHARVVTGMYD